MHPCAGLLSERIDVNDVSIDPHARFSFSLLRRAQLAYEAHLAEPFRPLQGDPRKANPFILNIAALLIRGISMPDGFPDAELRSVIYQCVMLFFNCAVSP